MTRQIHTAHLFPKIDRMLLDLLRQLDASDWNKPTLAGQWKVKDIAAHLLDGNIRGISVLRDHFLGKPPEGINSYQDLIKYLNQLNADWIKAMSRMSPALLIEMLESTGQSYSQQIQLLNPDEPAIFSVAWAGESQSANWFHIAREYTEKWHHQQQIRMAVGAEAALFAKTYYHPYLETSMRALPHHYRTIHPPVGTLLQFIVTGEGGGIWILQREEGVWKLRDEASQEITSSVIIPGKIAWRLFTKGIGQPEAEAHLQFEGNIEFGKHIIKMLAVMA